MPLLYWRPLSNLFYQENMFELVLQQIGHRIVWYLLLTLFKKKKQRKNEGKINLEFIFQRFQTDSDPLNTGTLNTGLTVCISKVASLSLEANVYSTNFCSQPSTIFLICMSFEFKQLLSATRQKYTDTTTKQMIYFELKDHKALHFQ